MLKPYMLTDEDAAQVKAILLTQAEMQDQRVHGNMEVMGRLKRDIPDEADETIVDLAEHNLVLEGDCDNLKRIAQIFE